MIKTVLVGLGSIGGDKPIQVDYPGGRQLTHLHAIVESERGFILHGVVDVDVPKCNRLLAKWGKKSGVYCSDSVFGIAGNHAVSFVVIAVPAEKQLEILQQCVAAFPNCKDYLIEKPVGSTRGEFEKIKNI